MRLNKFLSKTGIVSRRGADRMILSGKVSVNDMVVTELGSVIDEKNDTVSVDGKTLSLPKEFLYLALNKPVGYLVTLNDKFGRPTVMELMGEYRKKVRPIGRLDLDSSGLLLFTNDGEFAFRLSHPRYEIDKKYLVKCESFITDESISRLEKGIELDDGITSPAIIKLISRTKAFCRFYITIHEGRKRQIRRMCSAIGSEVLTLRRISIGKIELGDLKPGKYRSLEKTEINELKENLGL